MSNIPDSLKYTKTHEWVLDNGDGTVTVGITDHAQELLGDMVFVELPEEGTGTSAGDEIVVVESVKAASDVYTPVSGDVVAVNEALTDTPELVNQQAYDDGWLVKIRMSDDGDLEGLLDAEQYSNHIADEDES